MARRLMSAIAVAALAAGAAGSRPPVQHQWTNHPSAAGSPAGYQPCAAEEDTSLRGASYARCVAQEVALSAAVMHRIADLSAHPEQAGCLGKDEVTCLATLARSVVVTTSLMVPADLVTTVPEDINGQAVRKIVNFSLFAEPSVTVAKQAHPASVMMWLGKGAVVTKLDVNLPADPLLAHTAADWDATGIYDFTRAVLGASCVSEDRVTFYRGADATIKGNGEASTNYSGGADATLGHSWGASTSRCGMNIRLVSASGESAMYGSYGGGMINFSLPEG